MKKKRTNFIWVAVVISLMISVIAFYLYDVIWGKTPIAQNLFRTITIVLLLLITLLRITSASGRKSLVIYEKAYEKELGYAFNNKPFQRKKLLCACRLYNEENYGKALKYLSQLLRMAELERDVIPVLLFTALCYTDAGVISEAIEVYYDLLKIDPNNSQVHNNLGRLYVDEGDFETALKHYGKAIELEPDYYSAYANRANCYFRNNEFGPAIADAQTALACKNNGVEAANLLTIVYALLSEEENKKKYYHIAIMSGEKPEDLNEAIQFYLSEQNIPSNETEE